MKRITYFDTAKYIAVFLVVWDHLLKAVGDTWGARSIISNIHMPLFFVLSGYFLYSEMRKYNSFEFAKRKALRLLRPYIVWSFVSFAANSLKIAADGSFTPEKLLNEAYSIFINARSVWFLIVLFFSFMAFLLAFKISEKAQLPLLLISSLLYLALFFVIPDPLFSFYKFKWLFPHLLLGYFTASFPCILEKFDNKGKLSLLSIPILVAYTGIVFDFTPVSSPFSSIFTAVNYQIVSILGVLSILSLAKLINCSSLGTRGGYTLDVYVIHMFFLFLIPPVFSRIPINGDILAIIFALLICEWIYFISKFILRKFKPYRFSIGLR